MTDTKRDENAGKFLIVLTTPFVIAYLFPGAIEALGNLTNKMGGIGNVLLIIIPITIGIEVYKAYTKK